MYIHDIAEWVASISCLTGMMAGFFVYYHMYLWVNKFDQEHGIELERSQNYMSRMMRVSYLFALSASNPDGWYQRIYRKKIAAKNPYGKQYLERISQETFNSLRGKSRFFWINFMICVVGILIYFLLERFV